MLDLRAVLEDLPGVQRALAQRAATLDFSGLEALNQERKSLQKEYDALRFQQNQVSGEIAKLKQAKQSADHLLTQMRGVADQVRVLGERMTGVEAQLREWLLQVPNLPHASVPAGVDTSANQVVRSSGTPPTFSFPVKDHSELGEKLGILDFERATKITGARFTLYRGIGAALERALINFMLDLHTKEHGYTEVLPPFLVNSESLQGTGQLPKFEADLFRTTTGYYLIPTAEVPVTNIHRDEILQDKELPISYCAYTPCFRSEAGAAGKDTKGLIRQHQFNKIELVKFTRPEQSYEALEQLTANAERVLQRLGLAYRVIVLCAGDMGFSAAKTYDIEVWFPSQQGYREISSCSNFEDFQARRANIRFRRGPKDKPELVHTLNGSGLAVGRTVAAILENYQQADGTVLIPEALRGYLGVEKIG